MPVGGRGDPLRRRGHHAARAGRPGRPRRPGARRAGGGPGGAALAHHAPAGEIPAAGGGVMANAAGEQTRGVVWYAVWATICAAAAGLLVSPRHTRVLSSPPGQPALA